MLPTSNNGNTRSELARRRVPLISLVLGEDLPHARPALHTFFSQLPSFCTPAPNTFPPPSPTQPPLARSLSEGGRPHSLEKSRSMYNQHYYLSKPRKVTLAAPCNATEASPRASIVAGSLLCSGFAWARHMSLPVSVAKPDLDLEYAPRADKGVRHLCSVYMCSTIGHTMTLGPNEPSCVGS